MDQEEMEEIWPCSQQAVSPFDDQVVACAGSRRLHVGGPAAVGHHGDHVSVQPVRLQLHPDPLVQQDLGVRLDRALQLGVGVGLHRDREAPFSRFDLLLHRPGDTHTHGSASIAVVTSLGRHGDQQTHPSLTLKATVTGAVVLGLT